ncbi:protein NLRC3 [Polymixia lowei]
MMEQNEMETASVRSGSFTRWEAVSAGGESVSDEDFYIPERRPSLDLGNEPAPLDTSRWCYSVEQARSPVLSYTSMESDGAMEQSDEIGGKEESSTRVHLERTGSYSSCYSLDSDDCEKRIRKVGNKEVDASEPPERPELFHDPREIRHPALTVAFTFKAISKSLEKLSKEELRHFKVTLWKRYPESFSSPPQGMDMVDLVDRLLECYDLQVSLQLTKALLEEMGLSRLGDYLQDLCIRNEVRFDLRETLKRKYGNVYEGLDMQGECKSFDSVFTNPYITTGDNGPNIEHEVRHIETLRSRRKPEKLLSCDDILSSHMIQQQYAKSVLTSGMAGTGKSMVVQRFILDWAEGRSHQHVSFLIPLPFRELNNFLESRISLLGLVNTLYPETKMLKDLTNDEGYVMFVCDGLDEYAQEFDFRNTESWYDHTEPNSLNVLVVNLLRGNLLCHGLLWVISRPLTSQRMPADAVHQVLEVRGFSDSQKEEYFKKRFRDPVQANRVIAHLNSCKTLRIMCHLPMFCWMLGGMFQRAFTEHGSQAKLSNSVSVMYTQFLLELLRMRSFRAPARSSDEERNFLMKIGKMAFIMLEKDEIKISRSQWKDSGVNIEEAVVNSGVCTEFIVEQFIMYEEKFHSFIHPTMQEYMAALYVFLLFINHGKNAIEPPLKGKISRMFKTQSLLDLYRNAVERSLHCQDGKLDIFLRFLLGMALKTNQELLKRFITSSENWSSIIQDTATLIRKRINENQHPERNVSLQHCLEELGV